MQTIDEAIRERAYHLWLAEGQRDGQADAYWLAAQRYVLTASIADPSITHTAMPQQPAAAIVEATVDTKYPAKKAKVASAPKKAKRRAA